VVVVAASEPSSVLTSWTGTLLRALDERGVDVAAVLAEVGLDDSIRSDPGRRIPLSASTRLWEAAVTATGDDAFGIEVSRHVRIGTFHGLGHAFMTSATQRAALERAARYSRVTAAPTASSGTRHSNAVVRRRWLAPPFATPQPVLVRGIDAL
jgi:hypothetical protein